MHHIYCYVAYWGSDLEKQRLRLPSLPITSIHSTHTIHNSLLHVVFSILLPLFTVDHWPWIILSLYIIPIGDITPIYSLTHIYYSYTLLFSIFSVAHSPDTSAIIYPIKLYITQFYSLYCLSYIILHHILIDIPMCISLYEASSLFSFISFSFHLSIYLFILLALGVTYLLVIISYTFYLPCSFIG